MEMILEYLQSQLEPSKESELLRKKLFDLYLILKLKKLITKSIRNIINVI